MLLFPYTFVSETVLLDFALVKLKDVGLAPNFGVGVAVGFFVGVGVFVGFFVGVGVFVGFFVGVGVLVGAPDCVIFTSTCLPFVVSVNVIVPVLELVLVFADTFTV